MHSWKHSLIKKIFIHKRYSFIKNIHSKRTHRWPTWPCFCQSASQSLARMMIDEIVDYMTWIYTFLQSNLHSLIKTIFIDEPPKLGLICRFFCPPITYCMTTLLRSIGQVVSSSQMLVFNFLSLWRTPESSLRSRET